MVSVFLFFCQAEDGIRDKLVTGVQTCALPISVSAAVRSSTIWVLVSVLIAVALIGPIGLTTTRKVLARLARLTQAIARLAKNDTEADIPSCGDRDEVGEIARAVAVFKDNAI